MAGERGDPDAVLNVSMAAERTWLAWWRTALVATAGTLGVGRLAPQLVDAAPGPYMVLGAGYAAIAIGMLVVGLRRQRAIVSASERGEPAPLSHGTTTAFTVGAGVLVILTLVVVLARL
jgi:uncharacterized membrane protein YidH (DUF202 family)